MPWLRPTLASLVTPGLLRHDAAHSRMSSIRILADSTSCHRQRRVENVRQVSPDGSTGSRADLRRTFSRKAMRRGLCVSLIHVSLNQNRARWRISTASFCGIWPDPPSLRSKGFDFEPNLEFPVLDHSARIGARNSLNQRANKKRGVLRQSDSYKKNVARAEQTAGATLHVDKDGKFLADPSAIKTSVAFNSHLAAAE